MSWDLDAIREGLAATLSNIPGLRASAWVPDRISPPHAIVATGTAHYDADLDPDATLELTALVLVSRAETRAAQKKLNAYVQTLGPSSIANAVNTAHTLRGTVEDSRVTMADTPATYSVGGTEYYGVLFHIQALVS